MSRIDQAVAMFNSGFACSQSILSIYGPSLGLDKNLALRLADPFGAGMRGLSETCGAVTAAFMIIGLKYGRIHAEDPVTKQRMVDRMKQFIQQFEHRHGALSCKALLGYDISVPEQYDIAEQLGLFQTQCPAYVRTAAEVLEQILIE